MKIKVLQNSKYLETESSKKKFQKTVDLEETPRPSNDFIHIARV